MTINHIIGHVPPAKESDKPKKTDVWTNLAKVAKFASSYSKLSGVSQETLDFLKNMSDHLSAITSIEKLMSGESPVFDTLSKVGTLNSLRAVIARDFNDVVESEVYKLWEKSEGTLSKGSFSLFKTALSNIQGIDKELAKPLSDLSKDLSVLSIHGQLEKLEKSTDILFVHPEEHRGETEEAAISFTSATLGIASVVLPLITKIPLDMSNSMGALSAFLGLVELGSKSMLSSLDKEKRDAKDALRKDFTKLERENKEQFVKFRKSNPDHEYSKQFKAFHKGGMAKDLHDKPVAFQGMQSFYDKIDSAESSQEVDGILKEYLAERGQLDMPKEGAMEKTQAAIQKLRKKLDPPTT
jgi:hypothetical protein